MSYNIRSITTKILSNIQSQCHDFYRTATTTFRKDSHKQIELSQYIIVKATKDDYLPVLKLMHNSFYPDEPTCSCMGVGPNPVMDERVVKDMAEGMSLLARLKYDGEIVGACVNCSLRPWDPDQTEKLARSCKCTKLKALLVFYAHVSKRPDLWKTRGVEKIFDMCYIFVKPEHRRRGISFKMMEDSKNLATERGFKVIRCDATNYVTAKLCEKLGMKMVDEIPYSSYLGKNLEPVFQPPNPHESLKIYVDDIIDNSKQPLDIDKGLNKDHTTLTK